MLIINNYNNLVKVESPYYVAYLTKRSRSLSSKTDIPYIFNKARKKWALYPIGGDQYEQNVYSDFTNGFKKSKWNRKISTLVFRRKIYIHIFLLGFIIVTFREKAVQVISFPRSSFYSLSEDPTNFISVHGFYKERKSYYEKF